MFADVPDRLPTSVCVRCRLPINIGDAVIRVLTAAGAGPGGGRSKTLHINGTFEAAHLKCANPALFFAHKQVSRRSLKTGATIPVPPRAPDFQCLVCGKVYARADRLLEVYRAEGYGVDPATTAPGLLCSDEIETAHLNCEDPMGNMGGAALVVLGSG